MLEMSMALPLRARAQSLYSLELERMGILEVTSDKALVVMVMVVVVCGGKGFLGEEACMPSCRCRRSYLSFDNSV